MISLIGKSSMLMDFSVINLIISYLHIKLETPDDISSLAQLLIYDSLSEDICLLYWHLCSIKKKKNLAICV